MTTRRKVKDFDTIETRLDEAAIADIVDTMEPYQFPIGDALREVGGRIRWKRWLTNSAIVSVVCIVGVIGFGFIFYFIEKMFL